MTELWKSLWAEPAAADAPPPGTQDWLLVLLILVLSGIEVATREHIEWLPLALALNTFFAFTLPWRRRYALFVVMPVFGLNAAVQIYAITREVPWTSMYTSVLVLLLLHALVRWASGKHAVLGLAFVGATFFISSQFTRPPWGEAVGAMLFILIPSGLGLIARLQSDTQRREYEQVRVREREQLARELHDSVGHYVSAIAVQAQAGRELAPNDAAAPLQALSVIEEASRNALAEMRTILRAMRDHESAEYMPAASLDDISRLAADSRYPFAVDLQASGVLEQIDGVVASTLYRLTQEAITNSARHGHGVRNVEIRIAAEDREATLSIADDGEPVTFTTAGLGITGMRERVSLLGGHFEAGPGAERGWTITATLPLFGRSP